MNKIHKHDKCKTTQTVNKAAQQQIIHINESINDQQVISI